MAGFQDGRWENRTVLKVEGLFVDYQQGNDEEQDMGT